jgi:class 3 adenylate cyclase/predicted ATPase
MSSERDALLAAIAALETQRALLGEAVVATALAPLREKLAALEASPAVEAPLVDEAPQRKTITVLFADISGFTTLSEKLDAEDVAALVNQVWHKIDAILVAHGGRIDKHIGDAVMVLWGADTAREDDAEQAIRAALEVQKEMSDWRPALQPPIAHPSSPIASLQIRLGLNTGPALLGAVGSRHEFTAMGDTVNLAARLVETASPGSIVIAHATYRQVRGLFEVAAQPPLKVKGKTEAVQTYLVREAKPRAFRLQTRGVEGVETRMVGRDAELALLQSTLQTVLEQRAWRAVTVLAEAGMGKSRLLYEFNKWTELLPQTWRLFRGRADETMTHSPYALWRDVLAFRFEIQDSDSREVARAKLTRGLQALLPDDPRMAECAALLGHLIGLDFSMDAQVQPLLGNPAGLQTAARAALIHLVTTLAAHAPIALQLEDIHWADDNSLDLLEHLTQALPIDTRLLGIWLARPTLLERRPRWGASPRVTNLRLQLLSPEQSAQLAQDILQKVPQLPAQLQTLIVRNAAGNPFYLEELIKMFIDEGVIVTGEDEWRVEAARLALARVPPTLAGILQARLDGLPAPERLALQHAAVLGQVFWDDAVRYLAQPSLGPLPAGTFAALQRKELVFHREPAAFAATREFAFKHALLRDVTYDIVLKRERPTLHARAAEWLVARSGERVGEFAALIAEHYEKAGDALNAADYLYRVALRAQAISAYDESLAALERVTRLLEGDERPAAQTLQLTARVRLGEIYGRGRDAYAEAKAHLEPALALARARGDTRNRAAALGQLGWVALQQGQLAQAQDYFEEALPLARALGETAQEIYILRQLGNVALAFGQVDVTRRHFEASLAVARAVGSKEGEAHAQASLGNVYTSFGDHARALQQYQLGVQLFRELGERRYVVTALTNTCRAHFNLRQYAEGRACAEESLHIAREIGSVHGIAGALHLLGEAALRQDDLASARACLRESLALSQSIGHVGEILEALIRYAELFRREGHPAEALYLLGFVQAQALADEDVQAVLARALQELPADPAALQHGATLTLEDVLRLALNLLE